MVCRDQGLCAVLGPLSYSNFVEAAERAFLQLGLIATVAVLVTRSSVHWCLRCVLSAVLLVVLGAVELTHYSQRRAASAEAEMLNHRVALVEAQAFSWRKLCDCVAPCIRSPVQLWGAENSGTNYLERLLLRNFNGSISRYGHKHIHLEPNATEQLKRAMQSAAAARTPMVILVREPLSWLHSMYKWPYLPQKDHDPTNLDAFTRSMWQAPKYAWRNILAERTHTLKSLHEAIRAVDKQACWPARTCDAARTRVLVVRYEDARDDPMHTACQLRCTLQLCPSGPSFAPVTELVGAGQGGHLGPARVIDSSVTSKNYDAFKHSEPADGGALAELRSADEETLRHFEARTVDFARTQLDAHLERRFGYALPAGRAG